MTLMRVFVYTEDGHKLLFQAEETDTYASYKIKVKEKWGLNMNASIYHLK